MINIKQHKWMTLALLVIGIGVIAIAAYPEAFWQIGRDSETGDMTYKYGDNVSPSEHLTIFPGGGIGIGSSTLSDGPDIVDAQGSPYQLTSIRDGIPDPLKLDVAGDIGAEIFCDTNGGYCIDMETVFDIDFITDNSQWPSGPFNGQRVYNQEAQSIQSYKYVTPVTGTWEPTYTRYMQYTDADFPLVDSEMGDIVFNTDCDCLWCYDGYTWKNCAEMNTKESGAFAFDCATPPDASVIDVYAGQPAITALWVPINITGARQGPVTLTVNNNGIIASEVVELNGTETEIILNPLSYDGSGASGTRNFTILSNESTNGSCTGEVTIKDPGSFDFDCRPPPNATGTFIDDTSSSGSISIPIENAVAGDVTISVDQNGFVATEYITLVGGETSLDIDPLIYDGTRSHGTITFAIESAQGSGRCFGKAQLNQ